MGNMHTVHAVHAKVGKQRHPKTSWTTAERDKAEGKNSRRAEIL